MNREILFRGKRLDNGEWVYGGFTEWCVTQSAIVEYKKCGYNKWREVDPETVSQFTGLCDKDGTKIFEGDLLSFLNDDGDTSLYAVSWDGKAAGWVITEQDRVSGTYTMDDWYPERWSVVGNIWDGERSNT